MKRPEHVPEDAAREQTRREELQDNAAYQRGMQLARETEERNVRGALDSALADLKRATLRRDETQAGRDAYRRAHNRTVRAAENLATLLDFGLDANGKVIEAGIQIPAYIEPPVATPADTIVVRAARVDGTYRESRGLSPDGSGLPLRGPGSQIDPEWVNK